MAADLSASEGGGGHEKGRFSPYLLPLIITCACIALSLAVYYTAERAEQQKVWLEFQQAAESRFASFKKEVDADLRAIAAAQALFVLSRHEPTQDDFRVFVAHIVPEGKGIEALAWAPRVRGSAREGFEKRVARGEIPGFRVTERRGPGERIAAGRRADYFPVYYVEPHEDNEIALGFDLGSEAVRKEALERSRDSGDTVASAGIAMFSGKSGRVGVIVFAPVYREGAVVRTVEERRENLKGFAVGLLDVGGILKKSLAHLEGEGIQVLLYDATVPGKRTLLYGHPVPGLKGESDPGGKGKGRPYFYEKVSVLEVAGRKWSVLVRDNAGYSASRRAGLPVFILVGALMLTLLLATYLLANVRRTSRIEELAKARTDELAERARIERALRESEERYRLLADNAHDTIWTVDLTGRMTYVSPSVLRLTGFTPEEAADKNLEKIFAPSSAGIARKSLERAINKALHGDPVRPKALELEIVRKDGSSVWVEVTSHAMFDASGTLVGIQGASRDISERVQREREVRDQEKELAAIYENAPLIMLLVDGERRVCKVNRYAERFAAASAASMEGLRAGEALRCVHALDDPLGCGFGPSCAGCPVRLAIAETYDTGRALQQLEVALSAHDEGKERVVVALLSTVRLRIRDDLRVLVTLQNITERKLAEEELAKANKQLEDIVEFLPDATFVVNKEGKIMAWNRAIEEMTGVLKEDILGKDHHEAAVPFYGEGRPYLIDLVYGDEQGIASRYKYVERKGDVLYAEAFAPALYHGNGAHIWATASPLRGADGEVIGGIESIRDITEHKKVEAAVRESEQRYRELADQLPETVAEVDLTGAFKFINTSGLKAYGYTKDDLAGGLKVVDLIVPEERARAIEKMSERARGEGEGAGEYTVMKKDGTRTSVMIYSAPMVRDGRPLGIRAIVIDLTERKKAEEALRRAEEKYRSIFENAVEGIFQTSVGGRYLSANPALAAMYGYDSPEDLIGAITDIERQQYVKPEDRSVLKDLYQRQGFVEAFETQIYRKDGSKVWISMNARAVPGPEGSTAYYEGTVEDITTRKEAEEAVRESERRYRDLADQLPETVAEFDDQGRFTFVNQNGYRTFGYTPADVERGLNNFQMVIPQEHGKLKENMGRLLRGENIGGTEYTMLTKSGATFPALIHSTTTTLFGGRPGFRAIIIDITEQKRAEEALRESEAKFRTLFENANDAIFLLKEGKITDCNPKTVEMFRCTRSQILGQSPVMFSPPAQPDGSDSRQKARERDLGALAGSPQSFEWRHRRYDGTFFDAEVSLNLVKLSGEAFIQVIVRDITQRKQIEEKLRTMSIVDELTGLYNRRGFLALCQQQLNLAQRNMKGAALFFLELDRMKWINDTLGHREGDKALVETAAILRDSFRKSDIIGRMGGDEFAVLAIDASDGEGKTLERLRASLERLNEAGGRQYRLSVSVGVAHFNPEDSTSLDELMGRADNLMYEEKRGKYC